MAKERAHMQDLVDCQAWSSTCFVSRVW